MTGREPRGSRYKVGELTGETVAAFTGGDAGIKSSLDRLYAEQPVHRIHPSFDPAIFDYMKKAIDLLAVK